MSFRMDWLDLLAVQGTLKSLLQHHSSKASVLRLLAFFTVQLSHPYMTTGKTTDLTRRTFVGKVMSLLYIYIYIYTYIHGVARSWTRLRDFTLIFHFHALEKEMATHSSVLAWRIPGTGEPAGLPSMGSHRVGHDWSDLAAYIFSLMAALGLCCCVQASSKLRWAGAILRCGAQASHCSGLSCCRAWALGPSGFSSCGAWMKL